MPGGILVNMILIDVVGSLDAKAGCLKATAEIIDWLVDLFEYDLIFPKIVAAFLLGIAPE